MKLERRWQDWANVLFGVWLFVSPWALGFFDMAATAAWNSWILGVAVFVFALGALYRFHMWEEWINLVLGLWLILAPFVLNFTGTPLAMWNHIIFGVLIGGDALWVMLQKSHVPPRMA